MPMFSVAPRPVVAPEPEPEMAHVEAPTAESAAPVAVNPDFPHNHVPEGHFPQPRAVDPASSTETAIAVVDEVAAPLPERVAPSAGVALARANDGLPLVLDPYAVASRAVLVLIGSMEPAKHIARTAIEMSMEHDSSAALDVVIPRAIDLVLRRAAHLVSIGAGPKVVDHYTERLELWRRLARRSGLEPAAIVLTLAPFPIPTVASMLRVSLAEVEACIDDWYAGIDPPDDRPKSLEAGDGGEPVIDLREQAAAPPPPPQPVSSKMARQGRARWRLRQA
ncbi:MAG: hypothetical protein U0Q22_07180 [Acidimicrobiales bacterium]